MKDREYHLEVQIIQKQSRLDSGLITNPKSIRYAKRDIKRWQEELKKLRSEKTEA